MTNEQDEHVEDQTQASHTLLIRRHHNGLQLQNWTGSTYIHHGQMNTPHRTPQMQSGFSGSHGGIGSKFLPLEETST